MAVEVEDTAPTLHFSTGSLPALGRATAIREYLAELMRVDFAALDPAEPIPYLARLRVLDGASWGTAQTSSVMSGRTRELLKDGQDDLLLTVADADMVLRLPGKEDQLVRAGDGLLLSYAREMQLTIQGSGRLRSIRVPHRPIMDAAPGIGAAPAAVIPRGASMLSLAYHYSSLLEDDPLSGAAAQRMAAKHLQDIVAMVVGASGDVREEAQATSIAAAHLATTRAEISQNLGNAALGIKWIAARRRVTPRHLQRLFAQEGTSFSNVLRRARVDRARALLEDPRNRTRTILSIALECGFPEASALNRAFRHELGLTPSDVRQGAGGTVAGQDD